MRVLERKANMSDELKDNEQPYYDPEWLKEYVRENKDSGSKIAEIYMEGFAEGKKEAKEELIRVIKSEYEKREVPTVTFEEFLKP